MWREKGGPMQMCTKHTTCHADKDVRFAAKRRAESSPAAVDADTTQSHTILSVFIPSVSFDEVRLLLHDAQQGWGSGG